MDKIIAFDQSDPPGDLYGSRASTAEERPTRDKVAALHIDLTRLMWLDAALVAKRVGWR